MKAVLFLAVILSLTACSTANQKTNENTDLYMGGFDGVWVGELKSIRGTGYPFIAKGENESSMMLIIREGKVSVSAGNKEKGISKVKEGKFNIIEHRTNAIIYAQDSGSDNADDTDDWVETWNITVTHKDANSIYVYFVRSVNNFRMPHNLDTETEAGRFFYSYSGELIKVATIERIE